MNLISHNQTNSVGECGDSAMDFPMAVGAERNNVPLDVAEAVVQPMSVGRLPGVAAQETGLNPDPLVVRGIQSRDLPLTGFTVPFDFVAIATKFLGSLGVLIAADASRLRTVSDPLVGTRTAMLPREGSTLRGELLATAFTGAVLPLRLRLTVATPKGFGDTSSRPSRKGFLAVETQCRGLALRSEPALSTGFDGLVPHGMTTLSDVSLFGHSLDFPPSRNSITGRTPGCQVYIRGDFYARYD